MNPTAMLDQLGAACREAHNVVRRTADTTSDGALVYRTPGPFADQMIADLTVRTMTRTIKTCAHLRRGPGVAWLLAWSPTRVRCHTCAQKALREVQGTAEDAVCDVCRRTDPPLHTVIGAAGPVLLVFGACSGCFDAETEVAA